jgi:hypothetical protein
MLNKNFDVPLLDGAMYIPSIIVVLFYSNKIMYLDSNFSYETD